MNLTVELQNATEERELPTASQFQRWAELALARAECKECEITIRLVDEKEMSELNESYRKKKGPTNILSFPFEPPAGMELPLIGDLIICAPLVRKEAQEQKKSLEAHWAHLTIHGCLHLLGYDHQKPKEAKTMENLETQLLQKLGLPDPY